METFVGQSPYDARYALFVGSAAERFVTQGFRIIENAIYKTSCGSVEVSIIGESHFAIVRDRTGRARCAELLACIRRDDQLAESVVIIRIAAQTRETLRLIREEVSIKTKIGVYLPREAGRSLDDLLPAFREPHVLEHAFEGPCAPRTRVAVKELQPGTVRIQTVHEYVRGDFRIVPIVTRTVITLLEDK